MSPRAWIGTRKGLFPVEKEGGRWLLGEPSFLGVPVPMLLADPRDHALHAALDHGHFGTKMHRSVDGGRTWEERVSPAFPEKPEGLEEKDGFGRPWPWSVKLAWSFETGGADQPGRLWLGTIPGGLFRSDDGGESWSLVRSLWDHPERLRWFGGGADLPGIHSICVDPRDSKRVLVGVSCGGAWQTRDDGETWELCSHGMVASFLPPEQQGDPGVQDPHRIVQCPAAPDVFWAQHHDTVFRSTDDSKSWHEVPNVAPSVFGFAVVVHPEDPDTAWFVPAVKDMTRVPVGGQVVVARTRDGGETFDVLRGGLPQEHAYDLTYRHGLDVDGSGQRLIFGSTTGSLWVSEDQGESWQEVSAHLPPVYCVRWETWPPASARVVHG